MKIKGNLTGSFLLAGAKLGNDRAPGGAGTAADVFGAGSIANFRVDGAVAGSVVGAGLSTVDAIFKNADDAILGGKKSKVGAFRVGGDASPDSFFAAGKFPAKVKIGDAKVDPKTDPRFRAAPDVTAPVVSARLLTDTGVSALDGITFDPTITGALTDASSITKLRAGLDGAPPGNFIDVLSLLAPDRSFVFPLGQIEIINGAPLADGTHTLHLEAEDFVGNSTTFDFTFTLTPPRRAFRSRHWMQRRTCCLASWCLRSSMNRSRSARSRRRLRAGYRRGAIALAAQDVPIAGRIVLDVTGERLTFVPAANLPGNAELVATLAMEKVFDLAGNPVMPLPSETQFRTINTLGIPGTKVVGFVFDTLKTFSGTTSRSPEPRCASPTRRGTRRTDANGRFELNDTPAGKLMIDVDGGTIAAPAGTFYPSVAEVVFAAPGQMNAFPAAVFLPLAEHLRFCLHQQRSRRDDARDQSRPAPRLAAHGPGRVGRAPRWHDRRANPDRVCRAGSAARAPSSEHDPASGDHGADAGRRGYFPASPCPSPRRTSRELAPGEKTALWDFDHARGFFVPVGLATVSADGKR